MNIHTEWIKIASIAVVLASCSSPSEQASETGDVSTDSVSTNNGVEEELAPQKAKITVGSGVLVGPSDFQVAVAFYKVVGLEPPFNDWAKADQRVRRANEFDRPEMTARVQEELLLAAQSVADIGFFEITTDSNFGEYDMTSQGFRLDEMRPGTFYSWRHLDGFYKLTLENAGDANLWKINTDDARKIVESMSNRRATIKMKVQIIGALPEGNGGTLQGKIVQYEVLNREGVKIGAMAFN